MAERKVTVRIGKLHPYMGWFSRFYIRGETDEDIRTYIQAKYGQSPLIEYDTADNEAPFKWRILSALWNQEKTMVALAMGAYMTFARRVKEAVWEITVFSPLEYESELSGLSDFSVLAPEEEDGMRVTDEHTKFQGGKSAFEVEEMPPMRTEAPHAFPYMKVEGSPRIEGPDFSYIMMWNNLRKSLLSDLKDESYREPHPSLNFIYDSEWGVAILRLFINQADLPIEPPTWNDFLEGKVTEEQHHAYAPEFLFANSMFGFYSRAKKLERWVEENCKGRNETQIKLLVQQFVKQLKLLQRSDAISVELAELRKGVGENKTPDFIMSLMIAVVQALQDGFEAEGEQSIEKMADRYESKKKGTAAHLIGVQNAVREHVLKKNHCIHPKDLEVLEHLDIINQEQKTKLEERWSDWKFAKVIEKQLQGVKG